MDIARTFEVLTRLKVLVVLAAVLALFAGASTIYNFSLTPPSAKKKLLVSASASTKLLIDSRRSALAGDNAPLEPLVQRTGAYATLMESEPIVQAISRKLGGVPVIVESSTPNEGGTAQPANQSADERTQTLIAEGRAYRVRVAAGDQYPILTVFASAPTAEQATRVADVAAGELGTYLEQLQEEAGTPEFNRVVVSQLGKARGGTLNPSIDKTTALIAVLGVFVVLCLLIVVGDGMAKNWRVSRAAMREEARHEEESGSQANAAVAPFSATTSMDGDRIEQPARRQRV